MDRRDRLVLEAATRVVDEGHEHFGAAVIAERLRDEGQPLWLWEVRQALTRLAAKLHLHQALLESLLKRRSEIE